MTEAPFEADAASSTHGSVPLQPTFISAKSRFLALDLREMWNFRDLLFTMGSRDLKLRYRQTALGPIWVVLQPLLSAGVLSFVFGKVAHLSSGAIPYFVFSYAGMLAWNVFNNTLGKVSSSVLSAAPLISKIYFPRLLLPLSTLATTLIDFVVSSVVLILLMFRFDIRPGLNILWIPVPVIMLLLLGFGIGLLSASYVVFYRDVAYIVGLATQLLLYVSPVAYSLDAVPAKYQFLYQLNPLCGILEFFKWSCLGTGAVDEKLVVYAAVVSVLSCFVGVYTFRSMETTFADVI